MINIYFFLLLKIFNTVARSYKINWTTERTKTCGSICFCKDIVKIKLLVVNSAVTEVSELKNICIAIFKFFECKILTFITLNPSCKTRLIFKINVKSKA